jgi:hypothetical protein
VSRGDRRHGAHPEKHKDVGKLHVYCRTSKMSHDTAWRGACVSTIRDRSGRWLWRLVGPFHHALYH